MKTPKKTSKPKAPKKQLFKVKYTCRGCNTVEHVETIQKALMLQAYADGPRCLVWVIIPKESPPIFGVMKNPQAVEFSVRDGLRVYSLIYR